MGVKLEAYPLSVFPLPIDVSCSVPLREIHFGTCQFCTHQFLLTEADFDWIYGFAYKHYPMSCSEVYNYREGFFNYINQLLVKKCNTALEIGCQNIDQASVLLSFATEVTGISLDAIDARGKHCQVINGRFESFQFDKKFDLVISQFVLEHVTDLNEHVIKLNEILTEDGLIVCQVPNPRRMSSDGLFNLLAHEHRHYFSKHSLYELFSIFGFNVKVVEVDNTLVVIAMRRQNALASSHQRSPQFIKLSDSVKLFDVAKINRIIDFVTTSVAVENIVIYGAGLNSVAIFTYSEILRNRRNIVVVDDNALIRGKALPQTSYPISNLQDLSPNTSYRFLVLANQIYEEKIYEKINSHFPLAKIMSTNLIEFEQRW